MTSPMEPDDIAIYAAKEFMPLNNFTSLCTTIDKIQSDGLFHDSNPLHFSMPLMLLQVTLATGLILLTKLLLKPLNQPIVVSQILGGIIFGPSFLGRNSWFINQLFPLRGFILIDIISSFGFMFYFFLIGVQMDLCLLKTINKKTFALGFFSVAVPMLLTLTCTYVIMSAINLEPKIALSLPVVSQIESVLAFPAIAYFLTELKIINSEFGRIALASSMISGLLGVCVVTRAVLGHETPGDKQIFLSTIFTSIVVGVVIAFVIRPVVFYIIRRNPMGEPLKETSVVALFVGVLVSGFCCQATGLNIYYGPFVLGVTIPPGPPVGSVITEKLEFITTWIFMPLYFVKNGLLIDIFAVKFQNYLAVQFIALMATFGKFLGAFMISFYCNMPLRDAMALGLVMNVQGVIELNMFKMMERNKKIDNEAFVIICISFVIVMGAITPMIKYLYDPSRRYMVYKRRTVMHLRPDSELRILVCIHDEENVPTIINLLEALNPSKRSPLSIYLLHLIELVGRANPLLITHKLTKRPSSKASTSKPIVNAFRYYEHSSHGLVTVFPFTAISHCKTMHDDVCSLALDKRTSLIIVPFYKDIHANGAMGSHKKTIRILNNNVLDKAPCSIAILVDHGNQKTMRPILTTCGNEEERKLDSEVVSEFRLSMAGNYHVMYIEEVVTDGTGTISVIRSMENNYELILVGRRHDRRSSLISGLVDWNEQVELGAIGETCRRLQRLLLTLFLDRALLGKKGRQIDPALLGFKVSSNQIMMGEIQRLED
uniref:Uncharacterized protein n=1 Tax=Fagus sylvatica TaxID=28930 RepID=A0A2N9IEK7_FAGSY